MTLRLDLLRQVVLLADLEDELEPRGVDALVEKTYRLVFELQVALDLLAYVSHFFSPATDRIL